MSEHVPAWKRLGLKVKKSVEDDPFAVVSHLTGEEEFGKKRKATSEEKKEEASKKQKVEQAPAKPKKAPKRKKLPKKERAPPPEKDQLAYLRQFSIEREKWKFSKQKQNWILRNIGVIPTEYEGYLKEYIETMKGGSRDRVVRDMKEVVEKWNEIVEIAIKEKAKEAEKAKEEEEEEEEEDDDKDDDDKKDEEKKQKNESKKEEKPKESNPVNYDYAIRAKGIYKLLTGEELALKKQETTVVVEEVEVTDYVGGEEKSEGVVPHEETRQVSEVPNEEAATDKETRSNDATAQFREESGGNADVQGESSSEIPVEEKVLDDADDEGIKIQKQTDKQIAPQSNAEPKRHHKHKHGHKHRHKHGHE